MDEILKIKNIKKSFTTQNIFGVGQKKQEKQFLLSGIDLVINKGEITTLIGGNGTGKTTLFNIISGFLKADSGNIQLINKNTLELTSLKPFQINRLGVGRLFQDIHIFPNLTIEENLLIADNNHFGENPFYALFSFKRNKIEEINRRNKMEKTIELLFSDDNELFRKFWKNKKDLAKNLSFGQQKLLAIARVYMGDYQLILLDEPTAGVNPVLHNKIENMLRKMSFNSHTTFFIIEHNMSFMAQISDFCAFLNNGKIEMIGSPKEILQNQIVRNKYLGT